MKIRLSLVACIFLLVTLVAPTEALAVVQSLNNQTGQNQTFQNDSNVTISSSNNIHSIIWQGLLPISRGGTGASSFTAGSVLFSNGTSISQNNSNFFWDVTNNRLGIGTSSPTTTLDVSGNAKVSSLTSSGDAIINSLTVGLGGGSVTTNTTVGKNVLLNNTTGARNTAIGNGTMLNNTTGARNTAIGDGALQFSNGFDNTAVGYQALADSITTGGDENTAVGSSALAQNTTGRLNSAFGGHALVYNKTGEANTALGLAALQYNSGGSNNTAVGFYSLLSNTTGNYNVALGVEAGRRQANGSTLDTTENGVYIGALVRGLDNNDNNSIVIGSVAIGAGSDTAVIGNSSMTDIYFGSSSSNANTHAKKMYLGSSSVPGCIIMGDTAGGVGYITLNSGVLTVSSTPPSACQ